MARGQMDPPRPVLAATHRARESLRLNEQNELVQGKQQVDLPGFDFEIREDDGAASVVGEQSLDLTQHGVFRLMLHQAADANLKRRGFATAHRDGSDGRGPTADDGRSRMELSIAQPTTRSSELAALGPENNRLRNPCRNPYQTFVALTVILRTCLPMTRDLRKQVSWENFLVKEAAGSSPDRANQRRLTHGLFGLPIFYDSPVCLPTEFPCAEIGP